jgi:uncharacterized short protein YbdD (DUF466 family)
MSKECMSNRYIAAGKTILLRTVQTARLMVGVGDYQQYLSHMQLHHPDEAAMSEAAYFRYCQESRYPGKDGSIKRCPC